MQGMSDPSIYQVERRVFRRRRKVLLWMHALSQGEWNRGFTDSSGDKV